MIAKGNRLQFHQLHDLLPDQEVHHKIKELSLPSCQREQLTRHFSSCNILLKVFGLNAKTKILKHSSVNVY